MVGVVAPFPNPQDGPVISALKEHDESSTEDLRHMANQNAEIARIEGEKEKKRKAIAAKVAIPHIKLNSTRLPSATMKSDSAEARSPLTQITHITTSEDANFPGTDNKSTFMDIPALEPTKECARQQSPDSSSRSSILTEQEVYEANVEIASTIQGSSNAMPPNNPNDYIQSGEVVVSLSAEAPSFAMPITTSHGRSVDQLMDPSQPLSQPPVKSKKSKKKKNKPVATQGGCILDAKTTPGPNAEQAEETPSTSAVDDGIEFGEQKIMIDSMTKGRKSSISYYDKTYLEEVSPKARRTSQSADKGKGKAHGAREEVTASSQNPKVDRSAELGKLYEELTAELSCQDLFDPESTERKHSIAKVQMLRVAIDAGQEANTNSRSRGLDPETVKAVIGYGMTGDDTSKRLHTSKQLQGPKTPPVSFVKHYYNVKENEYIGKLVLGKSIDSEESGAEESELPITPPSFREVKQIVSPPQKFQGALYDEGLSSGAFASSRPNMPE